MEVKFNGTKAKIGNSFYVLIPMGIAAMLDDEEYTFKIEKKEANSNGSGLSL